MKQEKNPNIQDEREFSERIMNSNFKAGQAQERSRIIEEFDRWLGDEILNKGVKEVLMVIKQKIMESKHTNCENFDDGDTKVAPKGQFKSGSKQKGNENVRVK